MLYLVDLCEYNDSATTMWCNEKYVIDVSESLHKEKESYSVKTNGFIMFLLNCLIRTYLVNLKFIRHVCSKTLLLRFY